MLSLAHIGAICALVLAAAPQTTDDDEPAIRGMVAQAVVFGGPPAPAAAQLVTDEDQLREIQQRLANAWLQRDRAVIETVLGS